MRIIRNCIKNVWSFFRNYKFWSSERNTENRMSHLYFNEGSDYFGKTKSFAPPKKETKHVHVSAADLLHIVFRIENLDSCKSQKEPLEVFCEKRRSLKCRKVHRKLLCQRKYLWILQHLFYRITPDNCFWNTNISITRREI